MTNPAWEMWSKIGVTTVSPIERLKSYQTGSPFRDYELKFEVEVDSAEDVEEDILCTLRGLGVTYNSEWFEMSFEEATKLINKRIKNVVRTKN